MLSFENLKFAWVQLHNAPVKPLSFWLNNDMIKQNTLLRMLANINIITSENMTT